jgi:RNA polymerase sigma-70 factor (ECF subfamily)
MPSEPEKRFAQGDLQAFEALFRQFQHDVYRWIIRIVRRPEIAEDLTVETFWRIYRAHARFDPSRSFGAWARRIATNAALDYLNSARLEVALSEDTAAPKAADAAVQADVRQRIERAFRQLPADLQVTATLALIEEEPYEVIAASLGIPIGTVKSRVFRAIRLLRKRLKGVDIES